MALRNIFELLWSGEVKKAKIVSAPVVSYHGNWVQKVYPIGALVRYNTGTDTILFIANVDGADGEPTLSSQWDQLSGAIILPLLQVVDNGGNIMITSDGDNLKTI